MAIEYDYIKLGEGTAPNLDPYLKMKRGSFSALVLDNLATGALVNTLPADGEVLSQAEAADDGYIAFAMIKAAKPNKPAYTTKVPVMLANFKDAVGTKSPLIGDTYAGRKVISTKAAGAPRLRK